MGKTRSELNALVAEVDGVAADCGWYLEAAEELVDGILPRGAALEMLLVLLRKLHDGAREELVRVRREYDYDSPEEIAPKRW